MRSILISSFIMLAAIKVMSQPLTAPDSVKFLLDTTISIMQQKALGAGRVNWPALKLALARETARASSVKQAGFAFTRLFDELEDTHGAFYYGDTMFRSHKNPTNANLINEVTNAQLRKGPKIRKVMLTKDIAFINIPFMNVQDTQGVIKMANRLNDSVLHLLKHHPKGLIVDLRLNQGGNMFPMIAGLYSLFKDGPVTGGYSYEMKDENPSVFFSKDSLVCDYYKIPIKNTAKNINIPVAVLVGPSTASAGECTAAALTFRKNTVIIGEPTMGLTTANEGFMLMKPSIGFNLAVGVIKDGKGNKLYGPMQPDIPVTGGDNFENLLEDKKIKTAIGWIRKHK